MAGKTYLVTGANRGIGFQIVNKLINSEDTIIASVRDLARSGALKELAEKNSNVKIITLDISSQESIDKLDAQLTEVAPEGIDVFIQNAGIAKPAAYKTILTATDRNVWLEHFENNTLGTIFTTQAVYPHLLKKDTRQIIYISSVMGSNGAIVPFSSTAYGTSKAALNYAASYLASETKADKTTVVSVHPGVVSTDLSDTIAEVVGPNVDPKVVQAFAAMTITPEQSGEALVTLFKKFTPEDTGKFYSYDGTIIPF